MLLVLNLGRSHICSRSESPGPTSFKSLEFLHGLVDIPLRASLLSSLVSYMKYSADCHVHDTSRISVGSLTTKHWFILFLLIVIFPFNKLVLYHIISTSAHPTCNIQLKRRTSGTRPVAVLTNESNSRDTKLNTLDSRLVICSFSFSFARFKLDVDPILGCRECACWRGMV